MDNKELGATRKSGQPAVIASATEPASRLRPSGFRQAQGASLTVYSIGEALIDRHGNPECLMCAGTGKRRLYGFREVTDRLLCLTCNGFGFMPSRAQIERTQSRG